MKIFVDTMNFVRVKLNSLYFSSKSVILPTFPTVVVVVVFIFLVLIMVLLFPHATRFEIWDSFVLYFN